MTEPVRSIYPRLPGTEGNLVTPGKRLPFLRGGPKNCMPITVTVDVLVDNALYCSPLEIASSGSLEITGTVEIAEE